MTVMDEFMIA